MAIKRMVKGLSEATEFVMSALVDQKGDPVGDVGVFVIDGKIITTNVVSPAYKKHMDRFIDCMVGTYNAAVDCRDIRSDLELFA